MLGRTDADSGAALEHHRNTLTALKYGDAAEIDAAMDPHLGYLETITEETLGRRRMRPIPGFLRGE